MNRYRSIVYLALILLLSKGHVCSVERYSLSYCYFDEMAQTYGASRSPGWVFATRRNCAYAPTCADMCAAAKSSILRSFFNQRRNVSCYDAFHITKSHALLKANPGSDQPDSGKVNIGSYGKGSGRFTWRTNHCGPVKRINQQMYDYINTAKILHVSSRFTSIQ
ncbi:uncharacterized protein LOC132754863 [Ruditapes philippinarum]|uniref:uncharacterized protein LOC132754863 n=1 Tax=Ruditapes philippinarum TaxID=129788 RepID=UPI00295A5FAA|nr:uncharacterized protein LOC132754863 [Ruditapes philippinarum]